MKIRYMDVSPFEENSLYDGYISQLSDYRQKKINTLKFDKDKQLSIGAGLILMDGLKEYGIEEKFCKYNVNEHGKPYIWGHDDIEFNISHSGKLAVAVISKTSCGEDICDMINDEKKDNTDAVGKADDIDNILLSRNVFALGVDVEQIKPYSKRVVKRIFSDNDKNIIEGLENIDKAQAEKYFARVWTRIESYGKMTGKGVVFSDVNLKYVMDEEYMSAKKIYFKEYEVIDREENKYIISLCGKTRDIMYCNIEEITI